MYGIGAHTSEQICGVMGLNPQSRCGDLPHSIPVISNYVEANFPNKSTAIRFDSERVLKLIRVQSYRGQRHQHCLPLNGQKKTNARTQRRLGMERARAFGFPLVRPKSIAKPYGRR